MTPSMPLPVTPVRRSSFPRCAARLAGLVLAATLAGLGPVLAQDAKRGDDAPHEDVEPFYGDAQQSIAIQVPGFRGLEPDISLRYRSSRRDDLLGVGWTLGGFSTIEAAAPRRGTPQHNSNDIFILDGQELVPCDTSMVSPSCDTGGTHATKIESYLRIKLDPTANTWEIWNREGTKITLEPVVGQVGEPAPPSGGLLEADFTGGTDGFNYADGRFGGSTNDPFSEGYYQSDVLPITFAGVPPILNSVDRSGGWQTSFVVPEAMNASLTFDYIMVAGADYDSDEFSQVLVSVDGGTPILIAELTGDGDGGADQVAEEQGFTLDLGTLQPGSHTIVLGGYSNKSNGTEEATQISFDNVVVSGGAEPGSPYNFATTYRWAVSEVQDTHGNTVSYGWFNDDGEAYPETVSYNGSEVIFYWEPRAARYSTAIGPNGLITTNHHLRAIDVQTGGQRVRTYALTYGAPLATTEEELLASVQMYGKDAVLDANGTVTAGTSLPPTSFTYYDDPAAFAASTSWSTAHSGNAYKAESVQYADVNGDNLTDRIYRHTNNTVHVSLSDGTQFDPPVIWATPGGTYKTDQDSYADVNGDGMTDMVFRKSNNQVGVYLSDGSSFLAPASWNAMGGTYYAGQVNVGDVNGDGKADLVFVGVSSSCTTQRVITGWKGCGAAFNPSYYPSCPSGYSAIAQGTTSGSCQQGDETKLKYWRDCRRCLYSEELYLGISNGSTFDTPTLQYELTEAAVSAGYHSDRVKLADLNGDGMVDVSYRADGNIVKVGLSSGSSILPLETWHDFSGSYYSGQLQYADVNGDGTADAIIRPISSACSQYTRTSRSGYQSCNSGDTLQNLYTRIVQRGSDADYLEYVTVCRHCTTTGSQFLEVALSTGSGFVTPEIWMTDLPGNAEPDLVKFADFDGDGRADLSYRSGSNAVTIALSTGTQFTELTTIPAFNGGYQPDQIQLADVNGDGKDDVIHRATTQATSVALAGPAGVPTHALESVTNVYGGTLTYGYTPSSAWDNTNLPFVVDTVTSVAADDGRGGVSTTTYAYAGGLWDAPERRFLGFRTATATLPCIDGEVACPTVTTTFVQDFGAYSKPEKIERRDGADTLLTMVEQEYSLNGATIPYTSLNTGTTRTIYEGGQSRRTKTTRVFDAYANVTESAVHGDLDQLGDELTLTSEFYPNTADYIVGLPARLRQYEGEGTAGTMLTEHVLYYDGATDLATPPSLGDVTTSKAWNDSTGGYVSSATEYDAFGNVTATVDPLGRRSEVDYDSSYDLFAVAARNPLYFGGDTRQTASATWDELCQLPLTQIDRNGQLTTHQYDELCRGVRTDTPAGNFSITSYPNLGDPMAQYMERETPPADGSGNIWARSYLDGWGRAVQSRSKGPSVGKDILVDRAFDPRGNVASVSRPYYLGDASYFSEFSYDSRNREVEREHPDLNTIETAYGIGSAFSSVTAIDEVGHTVTSHRDAYGQVVSKEKALNAGTVVEIYQYDLLGRLIGLSDDAGNTWTYTYDSLGRRLTVDDPDLGAWSYIYDAAGQLTSQTDAKGQTASFVYDDLGRVTEKTVYNLATAQNEVTTYIYDEDRIGYFNVGHRTAAENAVGRIEYDYDTDGRLVRTTYAIDGGSYIFEAGLDVAGRVLWLSYPDGDSTGSAGNPITYDAAGRTVAIPGITDSAIYDARGWTTSVTRANDVVTTYSYSAERGWLENLETLSGATTVQDFTYQRRADGQILGITSSLFGESWTYTYDDLKRLISAANTDEPSNSRTYAYDTVDNITYKSDVGSYNYPAPGSPRPHAVTTAGADTFSYDANGNMTSGSGRTLTWDGEDRPIEIDGVTFHYGPDGARWKKVDTATGKMTLTLGQVEIQDVGTAGEMIVKYLPGSARRSGGQTLWHHKDHLNSFQAVTDVTGAVALRRIHAPYGQRIHDTGASFVEAKDYIGERLDEETGLLYLNARYYDPVLGRFLSGDPSSPMRSGVGVNRYAYSLNNPVGYSDPYGLRATGPSGVNETGRHDHDTTGGTPIGGPTEQQRADMLDGPAWGKARRQLEQRYANQLACSCGEEDPRAEANRVVGQGIYDFLDFVTKPIQWGFDLTLGNLLRAVGVLPNTQKPKNAEEGTASTQTPDSTPAPTSGSGPKPNLAEAKHPGSAAHDATIDDIIANEVKNNPNVDLESVRKNQAQVDANGNKVGNNRPDVQFDEVTGGKRQHHVIEVDRDAMKGIEHYNRVRKNDPNAIIDLRPIDPKFR